MSRISEMLGVLDHYPEFATAGVPFKKIVEACCRHIPPHGVADGLAITEVFTVACEVTIDAIERDSMRGPSVANYLVAVFKRMAVEGVTQIERLSRVGIRNDIAEMKRLDAETARTRAEAAKRPLPNPDLPKRFLAAFPPPPDPSAWPTSGLPSRPRLKARQPVPRYEVDNCEPMDAIVPVDTIREYRDRVKDNEAYEAEKAKKGAA
jgi:hypothetical protein